MKTAPPNDSHRSPIDESRPVREGEELDGDALRAYLARELGREIGSLTIEQFPGGHSNLTYRVAWDGEEYVLRRPPFGSKVKSAHDMGREFTVLSALAPHYDKAPEPIVHCEDESVIGAPFYLMRRIEGVILRKQVPKGITLDPPTARRLCEVMIDTLVELHALDYREIGLGDFGKPAGYIERQVTGWTRRYAGSQTDDIPAVDHVARWLADNMPPDGAPALIHNDFKLDNMVLDPDDLTRVIGILDWEMATVGDPLMDFGTALCYWVETSDPQPMQMMRFVPSTEPGMMTRRELADRYAEQSGRDLDNIVFYYCFGLFKTAVVAQQIYYRYKQGLTRDPRFEMMIHGVRLLSDQAQRCADRGSLG
jgi:aminoglycoside phosphotransferase (APT) family kinase protein